MTKPDNSVKKAAPLSNVMRVATAMQSALERDPDLPGLICLYGRSGLGKTKASLFLAMKYRAYCIEAEELWTVKDYLQEILAVMGIIPGRTISDMLRQVKNQLIASGRPLIIDEAGYLVRRGPRYVNAFFKDLFEKSKVPVLLVGEEDLPQELERHYEKVHNRILHWVEAQPCTEDDCRMLAERLLRGIEIEDDLLFHLHRAVHGNTRRVSTHLSAMREIAVKEQRSSIDLAWWGDRPIATGEAPKRRTR